MLTEHEQSVVKFYGEVAAQLREESHPLWVDQYFRWVFSAWDAEHRLIDVGCGFGRFAPLAYELGIINYLGIDPSEALIALARKDYPEDRFEVGSIYDLQARYPNTFDGFVLIAMLMHIPRARIREALTSLRASLTVGAVGFFSTPFGAGEGRNMYGIEIALYDPDELAAHFVATGFAVEDPHERSIMLAGKLIAI